MDQTVIWCHVHIWGMKSWFGYGIFAVCMKWLKKYKSCLEIFWSREQHCALWCASLMHTSGSKTQRHSLSLTYSHEQKQATEEREYSSSNLQGKKTRYESYTTCRSQTFYFNRSFSGYCLSRVTGWSIEKKKSNTWLHLIKDDLCFTLLWD